MLSWAEQGLELVYAFEPEAEPRLHAGRRRRVLEAYAPTVPGFFPYYPRSAPCPAPLRLFHNVARELTAKGPPAPPRRPGAERV